MAAMQLVADSGSVCPDKRILPLNSKLGPLLQYDYAIITIL